MPEGEPVEELHGDIGRTETSEEDIAGELILRTKNTMQVIKWAKNIGDVGKIERVGTTSTVLANYSEDWVAAMLN